MTQDNSRQSGLVQADVIVNTVAHVIGVGAVGYNVVRLIAAAGVTMLNLVDPDSVEERNVATQGFHRMMVGRTKVGAALYELAQRAVSLDDFQDLWNNIEDDHDGTGQMRHSSELKHLKDAISDAWTEEDAEPRTRIRTSMARFKPMDLMCSVDIANHVVFSCVDDMAVRRQIFEAAQVGHFNRRVFIDCRMGRTNLRVLTINLGSAEDVAYYRSTLFAQEAGMDGGCTARGTLYSASVIAGIAVSQAVCALHGQWLPHARDILFNLTGMELIANGTVDPVGAGASAEAG